jgi:hypothetical protein
MQIEDRCRIAGVSNPIHLVASHRKPWRDSSNEERTNGEDGLLLTPSIDHLFDRGFIGCEDNEALILAPVAHLPSLEKMGVRRQKSLTSARSRPAKSTSSATTATGCWSRPVSLRAVRKMLS